MGLDIAGIASALKPETAATIWSRFRNGERGLLDRALYTLPGQIAFDQISARYKAEPAFTNTVNRYLMDFEKFLREADQKGRDAGALNSYLLSDTGRVYLLLAHAAGRLS